MTYKRIMMLLCAFTSIALEAETLKDMDGRWVNADFLHQLKKNDRL